MSVNPVFPEEKAADFIRNVPQIVPEHWCLRCKVCCRFPDTEGVQLPAWSALEAGWAFQSHGEEKWFRPLPGSPSLIPRLAPCGEGYRCPAFRPESGRCSIYPDRPLDCRIYPFVIAKNPGETEVVLAMDRKCPYLQVHGEDPAVLEYAGLLARHLESPAAIDYVRENPRIIGGSWPEFVSAAPLAGMTGLLREAQEEPLHPALRRLSWGDIALIQESLSLEEHRHSGYTLAALFGWSDIIRYWAASVEESLCLFAQQGGGFFMPLPPLGNGVTPGTFQAAWELLDQLNGGASVSRIEGIEPAALPLLDRSGFRLEEGEPEYLYRRADLAWLRGERYRSQRGAANRFCRRHPSFRLRPFEDGDIGPCSALYTLWGIRRQRQDSDGFSRALVRDGFFFHRRLMMSRKELGLTGMVLEVEGRIGGYTLGAPVSAEVFCVFLEIADPAFLGAPAVLFREFCRGLGAYPFINAMGDGGLAGLRRAKRSYRPVEMARAFVLRCSG